MYYTYNSSRRNFVKGQKSWINDNSLFYWLDVSVFKNLLTAYSKMNGSKAHPVHKTTREYLGLEKTKLNQLEIVNQLEIEGE